MVNPNCPHKSELEFKCEMCEHPTWDDMLKSTDSLEHFEEYMKDYELVRSTKPGLEWTHEYMKKDTPDKVPYPTVRPLGDITGELEPLLLEMVESHELQVGEILNLIYGYLRVHTPGAFEVYEDNSNPVFYYGTEKE